MSSFPNPVLEQLSTMDQRQREAEPRVVCPECGSSHFAEVTFNQYSELAYGAGSGGDLRVISIMPQTIRVCLCGHPYAPNVSGFRGRAATAEMETFKGSLKFAHEFRKRLAAAGGGAKLDEVAKLFADINEFTSLKDEFESYKQSAEQQISALVREVEAMRVQLGSLNFGGLGQTEQATGEPTAQAAAPARTPAKQAAKKAEGK